MGREVFRLIRGLLAEHTNTHARTHFFCDKFIIVIIIALINETCSYTRSEYTLSREEYGTIHTYYITHNIEYL